MMLINKSTPKGNRLLFIWDSQTLTSYLKAKIVTIRQTMAPPVSAKEKDGR